MVNFIISVPWGVVRNRVVRRIHSSGRTSFSRLTNAFPQPALRDPLHITLLAARTTTTTTTTVTIIRVMWRPQVPWSWVLVVVSALLSSCRWSTTEALHRPVSRQGLRHKVRHRGGSQERQTPSSPSLGVATNGTVTHGTQKNHETRVVQTPGSDRGSNPSIKTKTARWIPWMGSLAMVTMSLAVITRQTNKGRAVVPNFVKLYLWTLLGSSLGIYRFIYLITVGYAFGIALPAAVCHHNWIVAIWGLRLAIFLIYRQTYEWPALGRKIQSLQPPPLVWQVGAWLGYSLVYACLASTTRVPTMDKTSKRYIFATSLQIVGLLLETVADWQKTAWKRLHRHEWCHVGLWRWGKYPNYAGEWIFWCGTALLGASRGDIWQHARTSVSMLFLAVVLTQAMQTMEVRQQSKYSHLPLYQTFRHRYSALGPAWWRRHAPLKTAQTEEHDSSVTLTSTSHSDKTNNNPSIQLNISSTETSLVPRSREVLSSTISSEGAS